jgi:chromosome segregation ATPase
MSIDIEALTEVLMNRESELLKVTSELEALKIRYESKIQNHDQTPSDSDSLKNKNDELSSYISHNNYLTGELALSQNKINDLSSKIENYKSEISTLSERFDIRTIEFTKVHEELRRSLKSLKIKDRDINDVIAINTNLIREIQFTRNQMDFIESLLSENQKESKFYMSNYELAVQSLEEAENDVERLQRASFSNKQDFDVLSSSLLGGKKKIKYMENQFKIYKKEIIQLNSKLSMAINDKNLAEDQLIACNSKIDQLT